MDKTLTFEIWDATLGDHAPFLISLSDGLQEELRIIIAGVTVGNICANVPELEETDKTTKQALNEILAETQLIEVNEQQLYEIIFHNYIIYQVRNESFSSNGPEEVKHGRYLNTFEKSQFLSYLHVATDAQLLDDGSYYPGKWVHYGIYTQNQIIDVIAQDVPDILKIRKDSQLES